MGTGIGRRCFASLSKAIECGANFIDTADVYGDGRSERLIGRLKKHRREEVFVATKAGRRLSEQTVEGYSRKNLTSWIEDSLRSLSTDSLEQATRIKRQTFRLSVRLNDYADR
jgi:aryl-alcohol dehydrogenase-like predicted oxidoreductase